MDFLVGEAPSLVKDSSAKKKYNNHFSVAVLGVNLLWEDLTSDAKSVSELKMAEFEFLCGRGKNVGGPLSGLSPSFLSTVML